MVLERRAMATLRIDWHRWRDFERIQITKPNQQKNFSCWLLGSRGKDKICELRRALRKIPCSDVFFTHTQSTSIPTPKKSCWSVAVWEKASCIVCEEENHHGRRKITSTKSIHILTIMVAIAIGRVAGFVPWASKLWVHSFLWLQER